MAMTKAEQAEMERLKVRAALHWTPEVLPDVPPPEHGGTLTKGWAVVGRGSYGHVDVACSSATSHALGYTDKTTSQQPISLYSTRLLALRAWRHQIEQECAKRLREIDRAIEGKEP